MQGQVLEGYSISAVFMTSGVVNEYLHYKADCILQRDWSDFLYGGRAVLLNKIQLSFYAKSVSILKKIIFTVVFSSGLCDRWYTRK
ncbi:MAG TPA: hypothetical protein DCE48_13385 [Lachnospiraceae bacterium]|nr:hypothetical protein [Lachnospiraceae bacterium]